jgi:hypothetical protein
VERVTPRPSIFRKAYDILAMFALLNAFGVTLLVALLVTGGTLDAAKARRIVAVLQGAEPAADRPTGGAEGASKPAVTTEPVPTSMELEIRRLEAERIRTELDQRLALNNRVLLKVTAERDRFQKERDEAARQARLAAEMRSSEGFQKQVAIFEALSPKVAASHLLAIAEPDEAARLLVEMDARKAKAIVEQAKSGPQMEKMKVVLQRVREVSPARSGAIEELQ